MSCASPCGTSLPTRWWQLSWRCWRFRLRFPWAGADRSRASPWPSGVAITYWIVAGTFEAMGNVNMLPAALAAWSPDLLFGLIGGYLLLRTPT